MKHVTFNLECNTEYHAYSLSEYDRIPIHSILYLKCCKKLSDEEWNSELEKINIFKKYEMIVHKNSICNTKLHL